MLFTREAKRIRAAAEGCPGIVVTQPCLHCTRPASLPMRVQTRQPRKPLRGHRRGKRPKAARRVGTRQAGVPAPRRWRKGFHGVLCAGGGPWVQARVQPPHRARRRAGFHRFLVGRRGPWVRERVRATSLRRRLHGWYVGVAYQLVERDQLRSEQAVQSPQFRVHARRKILVHHVGLRGRLIVGAFHHT